MSTSGTDHTAPASRPVEIGVDYRVPLRVVIDVAEQRVARVLIREHELEGLGPCGVGGRAYDGHDAAHAVAVARDLPWPAWRETTAGCKSCEEGSKPREYGPELEGSERSQSWLEYEVRLSAFVVGEAVTGVMVWGEGIDAYPSRTGDDEIRDVLEHIAETKLWPVWETPIVYCAYCGRGTRLHGEPAPDEEALLASFPRTPPWELR